MKIVLLLGAFVFSANSVFAYSPTTVEPSEQYEPIILDNDPYIQKDLLGSLDGFPELFEFSLTATVTLPIQIKQRAQNDLIPFRLILVRINDDGSGVSEIARFNQAPEEWREVQYSGLGLTLAETKVFKETIGPGVYRVEIGTSLNQGEYLLVFGDEPTESDYFNAIEDAWITQQHFNRPGLHIFFSSFVYYPFGIVLVIGGIVYTWTRRKKITHVT